MPSVPSPFRNNPMGTMDGIKEGDQGLNGGVMADGVQADAVHALHKVSVRGVDGRGSSSTGVGGWEASMAHSRGGGGGV